MKIISTHIPDVKIIQLDVHGDNRGFFVERYNKEKFAQEEFTENFVQDNHSRSAPGVLRGLHYQHTPPQGKLVGATNGAIWDVAVDIRPNSPTYGQYVAEELSDMNGKLLWVPAGFAHGFCVLGDKPVDVMYKVNNNYSPEGEGGIMWNDPELNIPWPITTPVISSKDQQQQSFSQYKKNPPSWVLTDSTTSAGTNPERNIT